MDKKDCFELGHITKTHGLKGFVTVFLDTDNPEDYYELESVFLEMRGELIPFFIEDLKETNSSDKLNIKFEEVDDITDAQELIKCKLYLPLDILPELEENEFYFHEIIGFKLIDETSRQESIILDVLDAGQKSFFQVKTNNENIVLIPNEKYFIKNVDKKNKQIIVRLPEGLMEL